jgi:hypothetical protein
MRHKVIQIAVEGATSDTFTTLFALTEDGRIWSKANVGYNLEGIKEKPWVEIEPIKEPNEGEDTETNQKRKETRN